MKRKFRIFIYSPLLWVFLFLISVTAQEQEKNVIAYRVSSPISLDGKLVEPDWDFSTFISDFKQFDPEEGEEPTERTAIKILYDNDALYIGVKCFDSEPSAIEKQITRRDRTSQADRFSVIIDSYHDHNTAFLFSGSVSGVVSDGILSHDGLVYDVQWDAVWDFETRTDDEGWTGEFKIPFSALRFSEQRSEYVWGINFRRFIARKKETVEWVMVKRSETPPGTISSVSKMGHLTGMSGIKPPIHLSLLPYGIAKQSFLSKPAPFPHQSNTEVNAGLDMKYGISNNFTLDLAINPDFGQVEVDQSVLNLTVFETRYPEKRPFFLDGSPMFNFGNLFDNRSLQMFYSRRIGKKPLAPYGTPSSGHFFAEEPQTTTILGAGKLTGRTEGGLSIGLLTALTEQEEGVEENLNGNRLSPIVFERQASYNVLRLKQDFSNQNSLGFMATGAFKEKRFPSVSSGIDWKLKFDEGAYAFDGYVAGSLITPAPDKQQTGTAGRIGLGKLEGQHWLAFSFYDFSTKNFFINDLGFYSQPREHGGYTQVTYKEDNAEGMLRRYASAFQLNYRWNWEGAKTVAEFEFEPSMEFRNFWMVTLNYTQIFPSFDDENRGIVGLYRKPAGSTIVATIQTDSRKPVNMMMHGGILTNELGMNTGIVSTRLTLRPLTWMEFVPAFTYYETRNEEAWVIPQYTEHGYNLFGKRDIDQRDISLRGTITFSPHLSLQFFTQVLLVKVHYEDYRELVSPTDLKPYDIQNSLTFYDPDFNEQVLNANVVLRWEYLPGSTAYVVWTQAREGYNTPYTTSFGEDFGQTFRLPMDNVLLLKLSYFWSL
ncbi:MAG: carbohydrate binding family 9 domain-containing protein [Ignavibacteriae bacterium]|nr:carbohydrate binding family 9 domain-containing protein [Ignavibacteriota bacterium]